MCHIPFQCFSNKFILILLKEYHCYLIMCHLALFVQIRATTTCWSRPRWPCLSSSLCRPEWFRLHVAGLTLWSSLTEREVRDAHLPHQPKSKPTKSCGACRPPLQKPFSHLSHHVSFYIIHPPPTKNESLSGSCYSSCRKLIKVFWYIQ